MSQHKFLQNDKFLLGTFSSNCGGGMTVSKLPDNKEFPYFRDYVLPILVEKGIR